MNKALDQHNQEIRDNLAAWERKPVLQTVYRNFHALVAQQLNRAINGVIMELGSGIGKIRETIPDCICTDLFENPWLDRHENAYRLSCANGELSNLILIDVFHHLQYPGLALREFGRVLPPQGRLIMIEPYGLSLLGRIVYGWLHHEPLGLDLAVQWDRHTPLTDEENRYFAAQAQPARIFFRRDPAATAHMQAWQVLTKKRWTAMPYLLSGGFSKPALLPVAWVPALQTLDRLFNLCPALFAMRMLVVLERK